MVRIILNCLDEMLTWVAYNTFVSMQTGETHLRFEAWHPEMIS